MASDEKNFARRMWSRFRRAWGITSSSEISDKPTEKTGTIYYGMFSSDELRHLDGVFRNYSARSGSGLTEEAISDQLTEIASSTKKKIDEIKNLRLLAPEIDQARSIVVSSIISPTELQTDCISVKVDDPGLTTELNNKITGKLTSFYNNVYQLAPKLAEWLGTAGFEEGAKPLLVLPRNQLDVLNIVADQWDPETLKEFRQCKAEAIKSTEGLTSHIDDNSIRESLENLVTAQLEVGKIGKEFMSDEEKKKRRKPGDPAPLSAEELAHTLVANSFKLLRTSEQGDCITVTRDVRALGNLERRTDEAVARLEKQAERQVSGFVADSEGSAQPSVPVFTVSDIIKNGDGDLPLVIELPCDSVIPVCAPRDHKNHIGYYILIDETGQPVRGQYAFTTGVDQDVNQRLAQNAAKAIFGGAAISTYQSAGMTNVQTLDKMTQIFSVAVNHLLEERLKKDGLYGLDINVHEAVGKSIFFNLLAKNKIKMVFVPASMMVYYRFLHREDGTGKTFLEDIAYVLALRCTLTVAKMMAAIEAATKHTKIEVQVDEKNHNPIQTLEIVRNSWLSKKTPQFTTDPMTAAESIINRHLSIVPKGLVGNTDNLEVTTDTGYGQSQAPDNDLMDQLNNWVGMGLKIPPSALNQLSEAEYSKSVATSNLFFSNAVRGWQNTIKPFNKKFVVNHIMCNHRLLAEIRQLIIDDMRGTPTATKDSNTGVVKRDDPSEHESQDAETNDETVDETLKRVLATVEVVLPPPNMAATKAKYEEVSSQVDAIDKILEKIYPDDFAVNDEAKGLMGCVRAIIASKCVREFLPTVGFHKIADVPAFEDIDLDESTKALMFINNLKRRFDNLHRAQTNQLAPGEGDSGMNTSSEQGSAGGDDVDEFKI